MLCFAIRSDSRPPFLFLPTGEKETRRESGAKKKRGWVQKGQNRASIPNSAARSNASASLVQDRHRQAAPTVAAGAGRGRVPRKFPHRRGCCGYFFDFYREKGALFLRVPPKRAGFFLKCCPIGENFLFCPVPAAAGIEAYRVPLAPNAPHFYKAYLRHRLPVVLGLQ